MTRHDAHSKLSAYSLTGAVQTINERGFFLSVRNPLSGWFEVVIDTAGDTIVQAGGDLSDAIYRACVSAMLSDPPNGKKPAQAPIGETTEAIAQERADKLLDAL